MISWHVVSLGPVGGIWTSKSIIILEDKKATLWEAVGTLCGRHEEKAAVD